MLTFLSINNFAVIEQAELEFSIGMTAITGESGVGKSVILDALRFTMGGRALPELVLKDDKRTDIRATFDINQSPKVAQWLKERDLDHGNECILRRVMTPEGRSRGYINGTPSTLSDLKDISQLMVHFHGQHGYQALMQPYLQREMLDNYAKTDNQARKVRQLWQACVQCKKEIVDAQNSNDTQAARIQLLEYQVQEINNLELQEGEVKLLEEEQLKLARSDEQRQNCHSIQEALSGDEHSILQQIAICSKLALEDSTLENVRTLLEEARIQLDEAYGEITLLNKNNHTNPARLAEVERRLTSIHDIARKHRIPPAELFNFKNNLFEELNHLKEKIEDAAHYKEQLKSLEKSLIDEAKKLSNQRKQGAKKMTAAISKVLRDLGMHSTIFHIGFSTLSTPDKQGIDKIAFQIKGSDSQAQQDLDKVASGGELSRISLAIQIVTARSTGIKSLVFDEVDVGIGGATAEMVGRLLRQLGDTEQQVLCVTHQAQVASQAHYHLSVIQKNMMSHKVNLVKPLDEPLREKEVARMIAGVKITGKALAHARDMLSRAGT